MWRAGQTTRPRRYSMKHQLNLTVYLNALDSGCLNGRAGQGNLPRGSLKYNFVHFRIRMLKCSYGMCMYAFNYIYIFIYIRQMPGL